MTNTTEIPTFDRLNSVSWFAGLAYGSGMDGRRQAEAVMGSVVRDARDNHYPVGSFILSFADGYASGLAVEARRGDAEKED